MARIQNAAASGSVLRPERSRIVRTGKLLNRVRSEGPEPHSAPALAEPAPALPAVKVRDQFGIDQTVQFRQCEASGPLDVATDRHRERIEVVCHLRHNRSVLHSLPVAY